MSALTLPELLDQDEIWVARGPDDVLYETRLDDMEPGHLENLRRWLLGNAERIHSAEVLAYSSASAFMQGEQAILDIEILGDRLDEQDPHAWLAEQPLLLAIDECLARYMNLARH